MQGSLGQPPITLQAKRKGGVPLLVLGLLLTFGGALMVAAAGDGRVGGMLVFAIGVVFVFLALLVIGAPAQLVVEPSGIKLKGALKTRTFDWDQVANFRVIRLRRAQLIGFDQPRLAGGRSLLRDIGMAVSMANISSAYDAALPGAWSDLPADGVAELLNRARAEWGGALAASAPEVRRRGSSGRRIDRKLYWLAACSLGGVGLLLSLATHGARGLTGVLTVMWMWLYARRLHDIGRSGWWQALVFAVQILVLVLLMTSLHWGLPEATVAALMVQFVFTIFLGALPGDPAENRFGPPPGVALPEVQAEAFR